jgi:hypothetical protein
MLSNIIDFKLYIERVSNQYDCFLIYLSLMCKLLDYMDRNYLKNKNTTL